MKRSLGRKVRALGILQVTLIAAIMLLLGVLFFNKMLTDAQRFKAGATEVQTREAEGLAKLLALELGRVDDLRYARVQTPRTRREKDALALVRAVLWEKVTFIGELTGLDLIAPGPRCIRPMGKAQECGSIPDTDRIMAEWDETDRMRRLSEGVFLVPLYVSGSHWGLIRMEISRTSIDYTLQQIAHKNQQDKTAFIVLLLVCLAAASTFLFLVLSSFFRRMHGPLLALTRRAVAFGERPDAPPEPVGADPEDEIGVLAKRFEEMQGRLTETLTTLRDTVEQREQAIREMEEKDALLRRSERLASVGVLAAGVAHEIGNKLNPMGFVVHNLRRRIEKGKTLDTAQLEVLNNSIEGCTRILDKLRSVARPSAESEQELRLADVVEDVVDFLGAQTRARGIRLDVTLQPDAPLLKGVRSELVQVVINLVLNARDAVSEARDEGGRIELLTRSQDGKRAVLEVSDNGGGMTKEVKARVFEPFFTTKGLATGGGKSGSGLGLYICYGILSRHGVEPEIVTAPGEGTRFVLVFPELGESLPKGGDPLHPPIPPKQQGGE